MSCLYLLYSPWREADLRFDWHGRRHDGWREEIRAYSIFAASIVRPSCARINRAVVAMIGHRKREIYSWRMHFAKVSYCFGDSAFAIGVQFRKKIHANRFCESADGILALHFSSPFLFLENTLRIRITITFSRKYMRLRDAKSSRIFLIYITIQYNAKMRVS